MALPQAHRHVHARVAPEEHLTPLAVVEARGGEPHGDGDVAGVVESADAPEGRIVRRAPYFFVFAICVEIKDNGCVLDEVCKKRVFLASGKFNPDRERGRGFARASNN